MAMGGLRPVVAIYSTFLNRAWDQILHDVGLHRLPVVFCLDRAGVTGEDGPSHHGLLDLMLLTKVPGMTVLAPSCFEEVANMLHHALAITSGPVALRWPKSEAPRGETGTGLRARRTRTGRDVCLLAVGKLLATCEHAAEILEQDGINASVWDVRAAAPLDAAMIDDALAHAVVVTAEDGIVAGGVPELCPIAHNESASLPSASNRAEPPRAAVFLSSATSVFRSRTFPTAMQTTSSRRSGSTQQGSARPYATPSETSNLRPAA